MGAHPMRAEVVWDRQTPWKREDFGVGERSEDFSIVNSKRSLQILSNIHSGGE